MIIGILAIPAATEVADVQLGNITPLIISLIIIFLTMIALAHILLLLLLILVVTEFNYNEITGKQRGTKMFIILLPQEK